MAATATTSGLDADELQTILAEQHRELMAAKALESDLDLAFSLQLQEALAASAALQPSSSATTSPPLSAADAGADDFKFASLQAEELERFERERSDLEQCQFEMRRALADLNRRVHDQNFAREIESVTDDVWEEEGDCIEKPFGEGCSSSSNVNFRLYFKGLVSEECIDGVNIRLVGVGIAICDPVDNLVFEQRKPVVIDGMNRLVGEIKALIEGLNAALDLDLKRIIFYCDYLPLFQYISGKWPPKQRKIATLLNQVSLLRGKFTCCNVYLVARNDIKFAFKLARDAIDSHVNRPAESRHIDSLREACVICLEVTEFGKMFSVTGCHHRFCLSCMKQHIEVKLLHGMDPKCPHEGCNILLTLESCGKFLMPKLTEIMSERIKERSIPVTERVYCPFPKCSALMSKSEALEYARKFGGGERTAARECTRCHRLFCINCKVTWHPNMTCFEYKRLHPNPPTEDAKLKSLATRNLWRQCVKCNHMIELSEGCYHMTCRCGYQFCYTCGAEWKNKRATCSCPLWDEDNIVYDEHGGDLDDDDDDHTDSDTDYYR